MDTPEKPPPGQMRAISACRHALWWTVGIQSIALVFAYYSLTIYAYLPAQSDIFVPIILTSLKIFNVIYCIYIALRHFKKLRSQSLHPLMVMCVAFTLPMATNNYKFNVTKLCSIFQENRENFAQAFCSGDIVLRQIHHPHVYDIPKSLKHVLGLNYPLYIECQQKRIIASFTIWGYLNYSEELMYRSDDSSPDPPSRGGIRYSEKIKENWYYIIY